jgi:23S rRNA pseudouridine1911/1915/1917 synthase
MYIRRAIREGKCEVNGRIENKGTRVRTGDFVEVELDLGRETAMRPEYIPLDVLHEDADLIAVNKPGGMLVHPTHRDKNGTLLNALSFHLNNGVGVVRPGLVHRLDRETSGIILIAKNVRAHRALAGQFQRKTVRKSYLALVKGVVEDESGDIGAPIGRFAQERRWGVMPDGSKALTNFRVIERGTERSLLQLEPITGRTNQLRIHCAHLGHPIVGDSMRGGPPFLTLCLHAHRISFRHPADSTSIELTAPLPFWVDAFRKERNRSSVRHDGRNRD